MYPTRQKWASWVDTRIPAREGAAGDGVRMLRDFEPKRRVFQTPMNGPGTDIAGPPSAYRSLVPPEEMRRLCQPVGWRVARDLTLIWVQIVAAAGLYLAHPAAWT